jgi:uncharacterized protein (DUF488 family)
MDGTPAAPALATVGYEGATLDTVIAALRAAQVALVIDVRAVAASRRAGFSKTVLGASLRAAGIDYLHLRDLGTPKPGREAARKGRTAEMRAIFAAHLDTPEAARALARALAEAGARKAALLCFEADPACCHRRLLAERMAPRLGLPVEDLRPSL